jgi:hypothetical protein
MTIQRGAIVLAVFSLLSNNVYGQFTADVDVHAYLGLDANTSEIVRHFLPPEIERVFLDTIGKALPMIRTEMDQYLKEVNDTVEYQLANAHCTVDGFTKEVARQLSETLPIVGKDKPPMAELTRKETAALKQLKFASNPKRFVDQYSDLYFEAAVTYCQMKVAGPAPAPELIENKYQRLNRIWLPLIGKCDNVGQCLSVTREATKSLISSSDPRDTGLVKASASLSRVPVPKDPGRIEQYIYAFDPAPYEDALAQLQTIQTKINLARATRIGAGEKILYAQKQFLLLEAEVSAASSALKAYRTFCGYQFKPEDIKDARAHTANATAISAEVLKALTAATTLNAADQAKPAAEIRAQVDAKKVEIDHINGIKSYLEWTYVLPNCTGRVEGGHIIN